MFFFRRFIQIVTSQILWNHRIIRKLVDGVAKVLSIQPNARAHNAGLNHSVVLVSFLRFSSSILSKRRKKSYFYPKSHSLSILTEGPFQSDALLVPEGCLFDHIHNASRCWPFARWNQTGAAACQERGMQIRSFAILLPCGISVFSGVEFVCCPKHFKGKFNCHLFSPLVLSVDDV